MKASNIIDFEHLIGLSVEDAREELNKEGKVLRVIKLNGKSRMGTADFKTNRLNVYVEEDKISKLRGFG